MNGELQKELTQRLGLLSGKPSNHGLHKHIMHEIRGDDPEMGKLDPATQQALHSPRSSEIRQNHSNEWHSDGSYEVCPPDFTMLRMTDIPSTGNYPISSGSRVSGLMESTGGDTLWASTYELYDRLSEPYQKFLETLTATHEVPGLQNAVARYDVFKGERGAPENTKLDFAQSHVSRHCHLTTSHLRSGTFK